MLYGVDMTFACFNEKTIMTPNGKWHLNIRKGCFIPYLLAFLAFPFILLHTFLGLICIMKIHDEG